MNRGAIAALACLALCGCATLQDARSPEEQVRATEAAFAKTLADRDFPAFRRYLAPDAVFLTDAAPLRGSEAVATYWHAFFTAPQAPFAWRPDTVAVLSSGSLALTSGPVLDAHGQALGRFNSIWRRARDGRWQIVFDKGEDPCHCAAPR